MTLRDRTRAARDRAADPPEAAAGRARAPADLTSRRNPSNWNRRKTHEHARWIGTGADERMRHARRAEREPTRGQIHARVADVDGEVSVEHEEPLVLVRVDVPRGPEPGRHENLDETAPSSGVRAGQSSRSGACPQARTPRPRRAPGAYPNVARFAAVAWSSHLLC